ncbi:MAG TPA: acetyl-coenzyme A synthetase N-terminal domain-containing protein, partial [Limnochorda sp.]
MAEPTAAAQAGKTIGVHWSEEGYYHPSPEFIAQANLKDPGVYGRFSLEHFPGCFRAYADLLTWDEPWREILDTNNPPFWRWFVGGRLNASSNCVDRHLKEHRNKTAIHFVPEPEDEPIQHVT